MLETELKWNAIQKPPVYEEEKEIVIASRVFSTATHYKKFLIR
jgi:hypothetical protein